MSRGQQILNDGLPLPLPEIEVTYVVDLLFEIGPVVPGGMGAVPLRSEHLLAWREEQGITLDPWESRMLRRLSRDYLIASQKAEKPDCPQPWDQESERDRRERSAAQVRRTMRKLK